MIDKVSDHMPNYLLVNDIIETKKIPKNKPERTRGD